jgi:hypothetical protein
LALHLLTGDDQASILIDRPRPTVGGDPEAVAKCPQLFEQRIGKCSDQLNQIGLTIGAGFIVDTAEMELSEFLCVRRFSVMRARSAL